MRDNYSDWISGYQEQGYNIDYQDETWIFKNMSCSKVLKDFVADSIEEAYKVPAGKGYGSIVCHIGSAETGVLNNFLLIFRGSKSNNPFDYHSEMNWNSFSD